MESLTTNPERFAAEFNQTVPHAYRKITAQDVRLLVECGLIGKYRYFSEHDIQAVISILNYELWRAKMVEIEKEGKVLPKVRKCKACGVALPDREVVKKGRRKQYCSNCEPSRSTLRSQKWRKKHEVETAS